MSAHISCRADPETHVASILTKLSAYSRAEAVAIGARQGLILL